MLETSPRQIGSFKTMAERAQSFEMESRLLRKDGTLVWVASAVSPLHDEDGGFHQATAIIVDITERKRAQDVERHLATIIASSNDAVPGIDLGVKSRVGTLAPNGSDILLTRSWFQTTARVGSVPFCARSAPA
ncbi:PAS domain S-box protein [Ensifer adhaerens]|uniref:PAS domain S-box protein n=1 Tax=Ensifer adhaerens TaxID=106592 RepID=UPI00384B3C98